MAYYAAGVGVTGLTPSNQPLADSLNRLRQAGRVSIPACSSRMRFDLRSLDIAERVPT